MPARTQPTDTTILVVDDIAEVRHIIAVILARLGYVVLDARDGTQALHLCERHPTPIHLLLTDVIMPDTTNGPALAMRVKAQRPHIRVLYMSSHERAHLEQDFGLSEDSPLLRKPFPPDVLQQAIYEVLHASDPGPGGRLYWA